MALDVLQGAAAYSTKDGGSTGANATGAGGGGGAGVVSASNNGEGGGGGGGGGGVGGFVDLRDRGAVRAGTKGLQCIHFINVYFIPQGIEFVKH